jgi:hypothetical protein
MSFQSLEDAVFNGSSNLSDAVRYVMQSGNPNELFNDRHGTRVSLLHYFVMGKVKQGVEVMLRIGADLNLRASDGLTPLAMAVIMDEPETIRLLVKGGADINVREPRNGDTPLSMALLSNKHECALALQELGANPDIANYKGITARHLSGFQSMVSGGWDASTPIGPSLSDDRLSGMSEEGLMGFFNLLPLMVKSAVDSGEVTPERGAMLNSILQEWKQALQLPLESRVVLMKQIFAKYLAIMGTPQTTR